MLVVNTETIPGMKIEKVLGLVRGNTVRAKWFGKDIMAGFRNIVGGELKEYTEMFEEAREQSINRMVEDAKNVGADAVVNIRFVTSHITNAASELLVYGTAVKLKK